MKFIRSAFFAWFLFVTGLLTLIGADKFSDFYFDINAKLHGTRPDISEYTEFCGYTGAKYPWESETEYAFRRIWNMMSATAAMVVLSTIAFILTFGPVILVFWLTGSLDK